MFTDGRLLPIRARQIMAALDEAIANFRTVHPVARSWGHEAR